MKLLRLLIYEGTPEVMSAAFEGSPPPDTLMTDKGNLAVVEYWAEARQLDRVALMPLPEAIYGRRW